MYGRGFDSLHLHQFLYIIVMNLIPCPRCYESNNISVPHTGSTSGEVGPHFSSGIIIRHFYCNSCFTNFDVEIRYRREDPTITATHIRSSGFEKQRFN